MQKEAGHSLARDVGLGGSAPEPRPRRRSPCRRRGLCPLASARGPHARDGEPGMQGFVDAFAPCDVTPGVGRQRLGKLLWPIEAGSARRAASASAADLARSMPWAGADRIPAAKAAPTTERRRQESRPCASAPFETPYWSRNPHPPTRRLPALPRRARPGSHRARFAVWSRRRRPRARQLWPGELGRPPNPREDRAERRSAGLRARWLPTARPQSDNCPLCPSCPQYCRATPTE